MRIVPSLETGDYSTEDLVKQLIESFGEKEPCPTPLFAGLL